MEGWDNVNLVSNISTYVTGGTAVDPNKLIYMYVCKTKGKRKHARLVRLARPKLQVVRSKYLSPSGLREQSNVLLERLPGRWRQFK